MASKKRKVLKTNPFEEMKRHGRKHERSEGKAYERSERGMKGYSRKRESY